MKRVAALFFVLGLSALYADIVVDGGTTGQFSNAQVTSGTGRTLAAGNIWAYGKTPLGRGPFSTVKFDGATFSGTTPATVSLGTFTLTNKNLLDLTSTYSADFDLSVNFTAPAGEVVPFHWNLNLFAAGPLLELIGFSDALGSPPPATQSFVSGGVTYTISVLGLYQNGAPISALRDSDFTPGGASADLEATITAVPEPSALVLLVMAVAALAGSGQFRKYVRARG